MRGSQPSPCVPLAVLGTALLHCERPCSQEVSPSCQHRMKSDRWSHLVTARLFAGATKRLLRTSERNGASRFVDLEADLSRLARNLAAPRRGGHPVGR